VRAAVSHVLNELPIDKQRIRVGHMSSGCLFRVDDGVAFAAEILRRRDSAADGDDRVIEGHDSAIEADACEAGAAPA
jgi:hypothetical protein